MLRGRSSNGYDPAAADSTAPQGDGAVDLESVISRFARVARRFDEFGLLDPGGVLELREPVPTAAQVRIEFPITTPLRLTSVIIEADGLVDPIGQTVRRASSAASRQAAAILKSGALLDPDNSAVGVHTLPNQRPWLEITFDHPVDLRTIKLRNIDEADSALARGIQVLVRTGDGNWRTIYDGLARERSFTRTVEHEFRDAGLLRRVVTRLGTRPGPPRSRRSGPAVADLVRILTAIQLRDYRNLFRDLDRVELPAAQIDRFRRLVSEQLLAPRRLEWNIHGIKRSFRFWSDQEKQEYLGFALDVIAALRAVTDNVCFGFGSVLSIVRDHELMPHDDDLDVLVGFERHEATTLAGGLKLIKKVLLDAGFIVEGDFTSYHWVFPPHGGTHKLDVFVGMFEEERISWYPGKRGALTRDMMFPPGTRPLLGLECPVPRRSEDYLEQIYGKGWVSPDPNFRHTWKRSEYADIAR